MRFGQSIIEKADPRFADYYISYKQLKKAITLITGSDTSAFTIKEVTESFGHIRALGGSIYRPPESRFQDLLQHELVKINNFSTDFERNLKESLINLNERVKGAKVTFEDLKSVEAEVDGLAKDISLLEEYQRLNFTGFRKICKKYDKNSRSASSSWFISRLVMEPFMNVDFENLLLTFSSLNQSVREACKNLNTSFESIRESRGRSRGVGRESNMQEKEEWSFFTSARYLVPLESVMALKTLLSRHLPIGVITNIDGGAHLSNSSNPTNHISSNISVVYMDNKSKDMYKSYTAAVDAAGGSATKTATSDLTSFTASNATNANTGKGGKGKKNAKNNNIVSATSTPTPTDFHAPVDIIRVRWRGRNNGNDNMQLAIDSALACEPAWVRKELPEMWPGADSALVSQQAFAAAIGGADISYFMRQNDDKLFISGLVKSLKNKRMFAQCRLSSSRASFHGIPSFSSSPVVCLLDENIVLYSISHRSSNISNGLSAYDREEHHKLPPVLSERIVGADSNQNNSATGISSNPSAHTVEEVVWPYADDSSSDMIFEEKAYSLGFAFLDVSLPPLCSLDEIFEKELTALGAKRCDSLARYSLALATADAINNLSIPEWYEKLCLKFLYLTNKDILPSNFSLPEQVRREIEEEEDEIDEDEPKKIKKKKSSIAVSDPILLGDSFKNDSMSVENSSALEGTTKKSKVESVDAMDVILQKGNTRLLHELEVLNQQKTLNDEIVQVDPSAAASPAFHLSVDEQLLSDDEEDEDDVANKGLLAKANKIFFDWVTPDGPKGRNVIMASVRVEPKTFFANERTLLTWVNSTMIIVAIGVTLLNYGALTSRLVGMFLSLLALILMVCAYRNYATRAIALSKKLPITYYSTVLPSVLVSAMASGLLLVLLFRHEIRASMTTHHNDDQGLFDALQVAQNNPANLIDPVIVDGVVVDEKVILIEKNDEAVASEQLPNNESNYHRRLSATDVRRYSAVLGGKTDGQRLMSWLGIEGETVRSFFGLKSLPHSSVEEIDN